MEGLEQGFAETLLVAPERARVSSRFAWVKQLAIALVVVATTLAAMAMVGIFVLTSVAGAAGECGGA